MAMNITKITQLAGVRYLLNTVATGDRPSAAQGGMTAYYTAAGTPPGRWFGAGAEAIGLTAGQPVTHEGAEALFSRFAHPLTGTSLGGRGAQLHQARAQVSANTVAGFDLTFRMPKSVSVLWGTADEATQSAIMAAHHEAIGQALTWIQDEVLSTRSGRGGAVSSPVVGMIAARFDHWDTRDGDPHLHTHVAVANRVQRVADGKWMTIDGAKLFRSAVAASELHENLLLDALHDRLGMTFSERERATTRATKSVVLDVDGVPADVVEKFSARATEIERLEREMVAQWSAEHGGRAPSRRALGQIHKAAWSATRKPKDKDLRPLGELVAGWRDQLRTLGHDPAAMAAGALDRASQAVATDRVVADRPAIERLARRLLDGLHADAPERADQRAAQDQAERADAVEEVVSGVFGSRATWTRANLRAEAERLTRLVRCAPGERGALIDTITDLALEQCVPLTPVRYALPEAGRHDPRVALTPEASGMDDPMARRYTHQRVLDAEAYLHGLATTAAPGAPTLDRDRAHAVLTDLPGEHPLAPDQHAAAIAITTDGKQISALVGPAGTGKTTTMAAVRVAWEAEHGPGTVVGLATSARAAAELAASLEVQTSTVAKMLWEANGDGSAVRAARRDRAARLLTSQWPRTRDRGRRLMTALDAEEITYSIRPGQLVIVDEASMTGTFDLAQLARQVESAGAKMLLVGDPAQLDAPAAGGMLGWLDRSGNAQHLTSVWRFHQEWEAKASLQLRQGNLDGLTAYEAHDRLCDGATEAMLEGAYQAVLSAQAHGRSAILIAATNEQVADLNTRFTLDRRAAGEVDTHVLVPLRGGADAGLGDVILARKVDRRLRDEHGAPISNGDLLTVIATGEDGSVLARRNDDTGARITLPAQFLTEHVELGYATTAHRAQGVTVDEGHLAIAHGERMTRELLYVAMTRGRSTNTAWVGVPTAEELRAAHQVIPKELPTAFEVLARALNAETAERAAHEVAVDEQTAAHDLQRLVAEYEYLARWHHGPALHAWLRHEIGDERTAQIAASPAWDALVATAARAVSVDPDRTHRLLRLALTPRPSQDPHGQGVLFDSETRAGEGLDPAALLQHRLEAAIMQNTRITHDTPGWVAAEVPELHGADPVLTDLAGQCAALITARVDALAARATAGTPAWLSTLGPRPSDPERGRAWDDVATAIAVYRDTYDVDTTDPLGHRPRGQDRRRDRHWQRLARHMSSWDPATITSDQGSGRDVEPTYEHEPIEAPEAWDPVEPLTEDDPWTDVDPWVDVDRDATPATAHAWTPDTADLVDDVPAEAPDVDEPAPRPDVAAVAARVTRITAVNAAAWQVWTEQTADSWVPDYLAQRGLAPDAAHTGTGWTSTIDALRARGVDDQTLVDAGLATYASTGRLIDRFRDRLAFPIRDHEDRIIAFTARANPTDDDPRTQKYLNTAATDAYDKSAVLYGLDSTARRRLAAGARPVLLEGATDVEAVRALGKADVVPLASCGTSVTARQLDEVRRASGRALTNLIVALDPDDAGAKAAEHVWQLLSPAEAAAVSTARMPDGRDPAQLIQDGDPDALRGALTEPDLLTHAVIDARAAAANLDHVAGRIAFVRQVAHDLRRLPPDAVMTATDRIQSAVGDGLLPSTVLAEIVDAYTPVQAAQTEFDVHQREQRFGGDGPGWGL